MTKKWFIIPALLFLTSCYSQEKVVSVPKVLAQSEVIEDILKTTPYSLPGGKTVIKPKTIRNVISKSIGCQFQDPNTGDLKIYNLIFKNTTVPYDTCIQCQTVQANQSKVQLSIFENKYSEGQTQDNVVADADATLLTDGFLEPLPPNLPQGSPIELKLKVDGEGLLSVDATDMSRPNGVTVHIEVQLKGAMTQEEFEVATKQLTGIKLV